jgi:hypothetical protein
LTVGFADLSDPEAVLSALEECERLGEKAFLEKHGFGPTRHVRLFQNGNDYPAKAILGVAHGYEFPDKGPLRSRDFTSGGSTISKFAQLGFTARSIAQTPTPSLYVVRGGSDEEIVDYALANDVVATGWSEVGDLSILDNKDSLDREMDTVYSDVAAGTLAQWKVAIHDFRAIRPGDWCVLPITSAGKLAVGVVTDAYEHHPENPDLATNCYPVRWLDKEVPRELLGDLRTRIDRQPAVHRIGVENAVSLVEEMLETRHPIRLPGDHQLTDLLEATLAALADKDLETVKEVVDGRGPEVLAALLPEAHPVSTGTGQATPAEVPWISVYPKDAAASAQQGIYAVYLFSADGSAVYLSFIQGTEQVAGGLAPLRKRALDMRRAAALESPGESVALASSATRPRKYEAASAYAIRYARGEVPADETLRDDLLAVLGHVEAALEAGLALDPTREPLHLLFKWSRDIEPKTIELHRAVVEAHGRTWWGRLGSGPLGPTNLSAIQAQLDDGVETHAYLYGDKRLHRTRLVAITTDPDEVPDRETPDYFSKEDCSLLACLKDFEEIEPAWALENLVLSSDPNPEKIPGALSNQTAPLFVYERFVAPDTDVTATTELDLEWLRRETLWAPGDLDELLAALDPETGKGQVILAGPPGTGKTWVAERVARYLTQDQPLQRRLVQFHPSYGYEEFVEGIRPVAGEQGISFKPVEGIVLTMAQAMEGTEDLHVLVIDELNRANIPRVFGELLYLLEYRDQAIELQYSSNFQLPGNLRIVATMNTADRSIRSVDVALRRRFEVFECPADGALLERYYEHSENETSVAGLVSGFKKLNADLTELLDRHHTIGQSFFMAKSYDRKRLERTWWRQIVPLIEDYLFDQPDLVADFTLEKYWPTTA